MLQNGQRHTAGYTGTGPEDLRPTCQTFVRLATLDGETVVSSLTEFYGHVSYSGNDGLGTY